MFQASSGALKNEKSHQEELTKMSQVLFYLIPVGFCGHFHS